MQLKLTGHHVEVTEALRAYIEKRLGRVSRHFDEIIDLHCTFTAESLEQRAEAPLHGPAGSTHPRQSVPTL